MRSCPKKNLFVDIGHCLPHARPFSWALVMQKTHSWPSPQGTAGFWMSREKGTGQDLLYSSEEERSSHLDVS